MSTFEKKAPDNCGPVGFWFWNDELDKGVIDKQLDEFVAQGFSAVVPHPRDGLMIPYLSHTWFDMLSYAVDAGAQRGLNVWFYDENPFPSGTAGGVLLNNYPHLAGHTLTFEQVTVEPEDGVIACDLPVDGRFLKVYAAPVDAPSQAGSAFVDVSDYAGLVGNGWQVEGVRNRGYGPSFGDDRCRPFWRAINTQEGWRLHWPTADDTARHLLVVGLKPRRDGRHGYYVDLLNPETTQCFIELTHEATVKALGEAKFRQFAAGFTDEPVLCSPYPWTAQLPDLYHQRYGDDLLADLPHLVRHVDERSQLVRYRYRRLIGQLWQESFAAPLANWFEHYDIPLTGHLSPEEDPLVQTLLTPNWAGVTTAMHWPGCDHITSEIGIPPKAYRSIGPKLTSSLAYQKDAPHVMCEALGVSGEDLNIQRMKQAVDWLAMCGVDTFVFHGQYMSLDGHRKREAPPSIFCQAPYWRNMHCLTRYIDARARWMQQSKPRHSIAVLYPTAAFESWLPVEKDAAQALAVHLGELVGRLLYAGIDFDLVMDHDLRQVDIDDRKSVFRAGAMEYHTLILPEVPLVDAGTYSVLERLRSAEITIESLVDVIHVNHPERKPLRLPRRMSSIDELVQVMIERHRNWLRVDPQRHVCVQTRATADTEQRCIWNPSDQPLALALDKTHCEGYTVPDHNELYTVDGVGLREIRMTLEPWQTVVLHRDVQEGAVLPTSVSFTDIDNAHWQEGWTLTAHDANSVVLSEWRLELPGGDEHLISLPARTGVLPWGLSSQRVKLSSEFVIDGVLDEAQLWWDRSTFGGPHELCVNGNLVTEIDAPQKHDIHDRCASVAAFLRPGANRLDILVDPVAPNQPALLDPLRLTGRFLVQASDQDASGLVVRPCAAHLPIDTPEDWCKLGFPHYSGTMTYQGELDLNQIAGPIFLQAPPEQHDSFEVIVNGQSAGPCCWTPFRCDITPYVSSGNNTIEVVVSNTSINRIEAVSCASGLLGPVKIRRQETTRPRIQQKYPAMDTPQPRTRQPLERL